VDPLADKFCRTPGSEDGILTVEESTLGGVDLIESREEMDATEPLSLLSLLGSEARESRERLEAGDGVRLLCGMMDVARSFMEWMVRP